MSKHPYKYQVDSRSKNITFSVSRFGVFQSYVHIMQSFSGSGVKRWPLASGSPVICLRVGCRGNYLRRQRETGVAERPGAYLHDTVRPRTNENEAKTLGNFLGTFKLPFIVMQSENTRRMGRARSRQHVFCKCNTSTLSNEFAFDEWWTVSAAVSWLHAANRWIFHFKNSLSVPLLLLANKIHGGSRKIRFLCETTRRRFCTVA